MSDKIKQADEVDTQGPSWDWKSNLAAAPTAALADRSRPEADQDQDDDEFEKELDRIIDEDEAAAAARFAPQTPPVPESKWAPYDASGLSQPLKVHYSAGVVTLSISLRKTGTSLSTLDNGHQQVHARATETTRRLPAVKNYKGAVASRAAHERAARLARAKAAELAARKEIMLVSDVGPHLAERLREIDHQAKAAQADAQKAEELAQYSATAALARRKEAEAAIAEHVAYSAAETAAGATRDVEQVIDDFIARAEDTLNELVAKKLSRDSVGGIMALDKTTMARTLLLQMTNEAELEASRAPAA